MKVGRGDAATTKKPGIELILCKPQPTTESSRPLLATEARDNEELWEGNESKTKSSRKRKKSKKKTTK